MSNIPFIAFYPAKWLGRTATLSALERGVFITLICEMYERMEPLKLDYKPLSRLCGCTPKTLEKALAVLMEDENKIMLIDGRIWNGRVQKEIEKVQKKSEIFSQNANKRWEKAQQNQSQPYAAAQPQQCYPEEDLDNRKNIPPKVPQGGRFDENQFIIFWSEYPHKVGKAAARKAFDKAGKRVEFQKLIDALIQYKNKTDDRPWCNPATWLNQERWDDAPAPAVQKQNTREEAGRRFLERNIGTDSKGKLLI